MADPEDVRALEALCPWQEPAFRDDLAALSASTAAASRQFASDAVLLSRLAARVPRCDWDETGATPWTSFRQEVAVARKVSSLAAADEIRTALRLTSVLPRTLDLLEAGTMTVQRARAFAAELQPLDDELARQIDADLAERVARLAPWRIRQEVRRAAATLDPDAAAARNAEATARRAVSLRAQPDGQAGVFLAGPAVPLVRWYSTLDAQARRLRSAGDPRPLDALRFDLATSAFPCVSHAPADMSGATPPAAAAPRAGTAAGTAARDDVPDAASGLRPSGVEAATVDCRRRRPVQAMVVVPVETALGLSNEPAWLDGYGWLDAPTSRQLLVDAELRRVCAQTRTGQLVDLAASDVRPPPTPGGVRRALLDMVSTDVTVSDLPWRREPGHDPSELLRTFVTLRDQGCDGPTQTQTPASRCELDHDRPHPHGPTAAWNLAARATRTHQLKHFGWTPLRTATGTVWTSPSGQLVEVPHQHRPPPGADAERWGGREGGEPTLPDPDELDRVDRYQLRARDDDDLPPWLPVGEQDPPVEWTCLGHGAGAPF